MSNVSKISLGSATRMHFRRGPAGLPRGLCPDLWRCVPQSCKSGHAPDNVMGELRAFHQSWDTNTGKGGSRDSLGACSLLFFLHQRWGEKSCPALVAAQKKIVPRLISGGTRHVLGDSWCFTLLLLSERRGGLAYGPQASPVGLVVRHKRGSQAGCSSGGKEIYVFYCPSAKQNKNS